jgi:TIM-barrel protein
MFEPRLAVASLSGESDAEWARQAAPYVGSASLGGIALDSVTREAAREMVDRDRTEFLPDDPISFIDEQLAALESVDVRPGFNVRSATLDPIAEAAGVCADHDAILEINAHCRQDEMCAAGAGQSLLRDGDRLCEQVATAAEAGADVSVKVRTEVVDLPALAERLVDAGADALHVDAMDSEPVVAEVAEAAPETFLVANNGVRDRTTVHEYLEYGADAVSVGRPSDNPTVLRRVREAVDEWFTVGDRLDPEVSPDA